MRKSYSGVSFNESLHRFLTNIRINRYRSDLRAIILLICLAAGLGSSKNSFSQTYCTPVLSDDAAITFQYGLTPSSGGNQLWLKNVSSYGLRM